MTFIRSDQFTTSTWSSRWVNISIPSVQAGDIVVAAVVTDSMYGWVTTSAFSVPSGWLPIDAQAGIPLGQGMTVGSTGLFYRVVPSSGTVTGTFSWPNPLVGAIITTGTVSTVVLRGMKSVAAFTKTRQNNALFRYPPVGPFIGGAKTGHVVRFSLATGPSASGAASTRVPSGVTLRQSWSFAPYLDEERRGSVGLMEGTFSSQPNLPAVSATNAAGRSDGWAWSIAVVSTASPNPPVITAPASGSLDVAAGFTLEWDPDGAQSARAISRRQNSGAWSYLQSNGTWGGSEAELSSDATSYVFDPGVLSNGATWDIRVATWGAPALPDRSDYATVTLLGRGAPSVSSVAVAPLSSGSVTSLQPTVTVTASAGAGGSLTGYLFSVEQDLGAGWVTVVGPVASASNVWSPSVPAASLLTNGAPIRFRAVAVQDGTQESASVTTAAYILDAAAPEAPDLTATVIEHPTSGLPGARVVVESAASGVVEIFRDGTLIRTSPVVAGFELTVDDYLASAGTVVYSAAVTTGDGVTTVAAVSPVGEAAPLVLASAVMHCWLFDPGDPARAVRVHRSTSARTRTVALNTTEARVLGDPWLRVSSDVASRPRGEFSVWAENDSQHAALMDLLTARVRLLYRGYERTDHRTDEIQHPRDELFWPVGEPSVDEIPGENAVTETTFSWVTADPITI